MKTSAKSVLALCLTVLLAGCVSTQQMPLAPNVVRIDTRASGLLFTSQAVPATMRAAAQATLANGYTHFKLAQADLGQSEVYAGSVGNVSGTYGNGRYSAFGSSTAIDRPVATSSATVIMFKKGDAGLKGAFDAETVLKQYPQ